MNEDFFFDLPGAPTLSALLRGASPFAEAPRDWCAALCDVVGSTRAIEEGRMQEVNLVGVGFITAMMNLWRPDHLAFVFGGDGAFVLLPPRLRREAEAVCLETRRTAAESFGLDLRAQVFTVADLCANGASLRVGKVRGRGFAQAAFTGGAVLVAERLLKERHEGASELGGEGRRSADFEGLTCPWRPVAVPGGVIASLLVEVTDADWDRRHRRLADIIDRLGALLGRSPPANPIVETDLAPARDARSAGAVIRFVGRGRAGPTVRANLNERWNRFLVGLPGLAARTGGRRETALNADYLRYDDILRCTLRMTDAQRAAVEAALEAERARGGVFYGVSYSREALITCVLKGAATHIALIDGAQGGYASAATMLKASKRAALQG